MKKAVKTNEMDNRNERDTNNDEKQSSAELGNEPEDSGKYEKREKLTNVDLPEVPEWKFERPKRKPPGTKTPDESKAYSALGLGLTLAFGLVVPIVLGVGIGAWIDSKFGFTYGTVVGFLVGVVLSFMLMLRIVKRMNL